MKKIVIKLDELIENNLGPPQTIGIIIGVLALIPLAFLVINSLDIGEATIYLTKIKTVNSFEYNTEANWVYLSQGCGLNEIFFVRKDESTEVYKENINLLFLDDFRNCESCYFYLLEIENTGRFNIDSLEILLSTFTNEVDLIHSSRAIIENEPSQFLYGQGKYLLRISNIRKGDSLQLLFKTKEDVPFRVEECVGGTWTRCLRREYLLLHLPIPPKKGDFKFIQTELVLGDTMRIPLPQQEVDEVSIYLFNPDTLSFELVSRESTDSILVSKGFPKECDPNSLDPDSYLVSHPHNY